jgi:peptidoglycan/LPS O-acetylase OafA/YrhL
VEGARGAGARLPHPRIALQATATAPAAAPRPAGEFHIPSLDGIRAISFFTVFLAHAGLDRIVPGGFGVTVFFFLSGYLITTLLRLEQVGSGRVSLRDFYLRRVLRILPPFYTVLALAVALTLLGLLHEPLLPLPMLAQLCHFTNYWTAFHGTRGMPDGTGVYWSLAVEEHFYLVFPWLFLLLQRALPGRFRQQGRLLWALCGAVLAWRLALVFPLHAATDRTYLASDTRVDSILFGCGLALAQNPMLDPQRVKTRTLQWLLLPAGLALLLVSFTFRAPWFRETLRYSLQGLGLIPLFVVAMRTPAFGPFAWLNTKPFKRLGLLSYSLYLVHHLVLYALERPVQQPLLRAVLALAISLLVSEAIHRLIEKPCARLRRRLAHAKLAAPPLPAAAS